MVEALGPHGGTIRLRDGVREIRVDVEEFRPVIDAAALPSVRQKLYQGQLSTNTLPLVQKAVPAAKLIDSGERVLDKPPSLEGMYVYLSALFLPSTGIDGKTMVRGQMQYTNGRFMYTASNLAVVEPNWAKEKMVSAGYDQLLKGLYWCHFPK